MNGMSYWFFFTVPRILKMMHLIIHDWILLRVHPTSACIIGWMVIHRNKLCTAFTQNILRKSGCDRQVQSLSSWWLCRSDHLAQSACWCSHADSLLAANQGIWKSKHRVDKKSSFLCNDKPVPEPPPKLELEKDEDDVILLPFLCNGKPAPEPPPKLEKEEDDAILSPKPDPKPDPKPPPKPPPACRGRHGFDKTTPKELTS